jgi:hypothetical protein
MTPLLPHSILFTLNYHKRCFAINFINASKPAFGAKMNMAHQQNLSAVAFEDALYFLPPDWPNIIAVLTWAA